MAEEGHRAPPRVFFGPRGRIIHDEGNIYERWNVCGAKVNSHNCGCCCIKGSKEEKQASDFDQYGVGIVLYFKYLKFMSVLLFILSLLQVPSLMIYGVAGGAMANVEGKGSVKALVQTTVGNLGMGETLCAEGKIGAGETLTLKCGAKGSKIKRIEATSIFVGDVRGKCGCPSQQLPDLKDPTKCTTDGDKFPITVDGSNLCTVRCLPNSPPPPILITYPAPTLHCFITNDVCHVRIWACSQGWTHSCLLTFPPELPSLPLASSCYPSFPPSPPLPFPSLPLLLARPTLFSCLRYRPSSSVTWAPSRPHPTPTAAAKLVTSSRPRRYSVSSSPA